MDTKEACVFGRKSFEGGGGPMGIEKNRIGGKRKNDYHPGRDPGGFLILGEKRRKHFDGEKKGGGCFLF